MPELTPAETRYAMKCIGQTEALNDAFDRYQNSLRLREHGDVVANRLARDVAAILDRNLYEFEHPREEPSQ